MLYPHGEKFPVGGSKVLRTSEHDQVAIFAAGVTVHEALAAEEELAALGIHVRVVDLYSVKPLDVQAVAEARTAGPS